MSSKELFFVLYIAMALPNIITMLLDVYDRVKNKQAVRVSVALMVVCFLGTFVAIFGFLTNGLAYVFRGDTELWFISMMLVCYIGLTIALILLHGERVVYSDESNRILFVARCKKHKVSLSDIDRINLSSEYLDIYIGKERLRCDNIFLVGDFEFERFVKEYQKKMMNR
ncbi:MAG: hypothetical protein IKJ70_04725 [Clostridia bacterium]|nr:hypothetical protein [Clostridia bacterium]